MGENAVSKKRLVRWENDEGMDSKRMGKLLQNLDGAEDNDINIEGIPDYKLPQPDREFEMDDSSNEEDDDEVLTECEEAVDDNESDSEGDSDSDSNWFSVMHVAVKKIPFKTQFSFRVYPLPSPSNISPTVYKPPKKGLCQIISPGFNCGILRYVTNCNPAQRKIFSYYAGT